VICPPIIFEPN